MSNNRKRNMRKLARNIITGTALAVGGLANVPQLSAAEQNGEVKAAGQPDSGINGAAAVGVATGLGSLAIGGASLYVSHNDSKAAREQTRIENERKSRLDTESSEREKARVAKEKAMDESSLDDTGLGHVMNTLNTIQKRNGLSPNWSKEKVRKVLINGGQLTKRLLQKANNGAPETGANDFNKEFRDVLCETKKGNELLQKILENIPKHMGGASITKMRTVHLNARSNNADAAANLALPNAGAADSHCAWIDDTGTLAPAALAATATGAAQQSGQAPGIKWRWRKEMTAAVDEALPASLEDFKGMIPIGFVMGAPSDNAGAGRRDIHYLAGGGAGGAVASSFDETLKYLAAPANAQAVTNLKEGNSNFAITIGKMQDEVNENQTPASRHGVFPIDLFGKIGELKAETVKNLDKAIRKAWIENAVDSAVENNMGSEDDDF